MAGALQRDRYLRELKKMNKKMGLDCIAHPFSILFVLG
jgi:hypothetical protein